MNIVLQGYGPRRRNFVFGVTSALEEPVVVASVVEKEVQVSAEVVVVEVVAAESTPLDVGVDVEKC